jgi:replicative DNA helicase Mcm
MRDARLTTEQNKDVKDWLLDKAVRYTEIGLPTVLLKGNHHPPTGLQQKLAENPSYYLENRERLSIDIKRYNIKNLAVLFGPAAKKDDTGNDLIIHDLDTDSEECYTAVKRILDELKQQTLVIKTFKPYGYSVIWAEYANSSKSHRSIGPGHCKSINCIFEIKCENNAHATVPDSSHRKHKDFRYTHVGQMKLTVINGLYDKLVNEVLKGFIRQDKHPYANSNTGQHQHEQETQHDVNNHKKNVHFYNLSAEAIEFSVSYLLSHYKEHTRHSFSLAFSGMAWYSSISYESATKILSEICRRTADNEIKDRLQTLHDTYKKALNGEKVTGSPTLSDIIVQVSNCSTDASRKKARRLKMVWYDDIGVSYHTWNNTGRHNSKGNGKSKQKQTEKTILSVLQAKMLNSGNANVRGRIMTCSGIFKMISLTTYRCLNSECGYNATLKHQRPLISTNDKDSSSKCPKCNKNSASTSFTYVNAVQVELQDPEKPNEIDRLIVYLFEDNTRDLKVGEIIIIEGNVYVIRRKESKSNKFISALFGQHYTYENRQDLILTQSDIDEIISCKERHGYGWIDHLVSLFAPNISRNYYPKLRLLLSAASSGPDGVFRKRDRIHVLLVGEPGLAKTILIYDATLLVPNSKYMSLSNTSGISLTAMIEKDESGGGYNLRVGSIILAKDAIFAANEIGDLNFKNQIYLGDIMEEGIAHISKYTIDAEMIAPVTMIAACSPVGTYWKYEDHIELSEIPLPPKEIDRYDLHFFLRMPRDKETLTEFAEEISRCEKENPLPIDYTFLQKIILYSKKFKPKLSVDVIKAIQIFWVEAATKRGSVRIKNTLERLTKTFAKLNFKSVADIEDAEDAIRIYKEVDSQYDKFDVVSKDPRDLSFNECVEILKKSAPRVMRPDELVSIACSMNEQIAAYFSGQRRLKTSYKVQVIKDMLLQHPDIHLVSKSPVLLQWVEKSKQNQNQEDTTNQQKQSTDKDASNKEQEKSGDESEVSKVGRITGQKNVDNQNESMNINEQYAVCKPQQIIASGERILSHIESDKANDQTLPTSLSSPESSMQNKNDKVIEQKLQLIHSISAHILTNDQIDNDEEI